MQTNYRVTVIAFSTRTSIPKAKAPVIERWIRLADLATLPLTGLARKIFLRLKLIVLPGKHN